MYGMMKTKMCFILNSSNKYKKQSRLLKYVELFGSGKHRSRNTLPAELLKRSKLCVPVLFSVLKHHFFLSQ
jgi:hypothetical protein